MKEWPIFYVGIIAAALCCLLTPLVLLSLSAAGLWSIMGDAAVPLIIGAVVLAALLLWAWRRPRRRAIDQPEKGA